MRGVSSFDFRQIIKVRKKRASTGVKPMTKTGIHDKCSNKNLLIARQSSINGPMKDILQVVFLFYSKLPSAQTLNSNENSSHFQNLDSDIRKEC